MNKRSQTFRKKVIERDKMLKKVVERKKWILEGFYSSWLGPAYKKADVAIFLRVNLATAKLRVIKRFLRRKLIEKKNKKVNKSFKTMLGLLKYLSDTKYNKKVNSLKNTAEKYSKKAIVLNNKKEIKSFINNLK